MTPADIDSTLQEIAFDMHTVGAIDYDSALHALRRMVYHDALRAGQSLVASIGSGIVHRAPAHRARLTAWRKGRQK